MAAAARSASPSPNPLLFLHLPHPSSSSPVLRRHHRPLLYILVGQPSSHSAPAASIQCGGGGRWWRRRIALPVVTGKLLQRPPSSSSEGTGERGDRRSVSEEGDGSLDRGDERAGEPGEAIRRGDESYEGGGGSGQEAPTRRGGSGPAGSQNQRPLGFPESLSLGIREPVYEVIEVRSDGVMSTKKINRRQLLKSSGLRLRDIRSVDPSLWLTNSMPSLLVRDQAILLNLGSLRAIAMKEHVLLFDYNRKGGKAFLKILLPRLNPKNVNGSPCMPFELEVVEAALLSRIQRLEKKLMDVEPRVSVGTSPIQCGYYCLLILSFAVFFCVFCQTQEPA
ncbi:hypothetical protein Taro_034002 [Colocasia esculenta]|uniref:Uncharacterized protein n=1 Tax=Colocasia esculenta TaxID=4460 RepID=A0A843W1N6_COLES|nr:hypothetical protein [Colocasia esculenta]